MYGGGKEEEEEDIQLSALLLVVLLERVMDGLAVASPTSSPSQPLIRKRVEGGG